MIIFLLYYAAWQLLQTSRTEMKKPDKFPHSVEAAIEDSPPQKPLLPLIHVTKSEHFSNIYTSGLMELRPCSVFDQDLIYLFYGRSSYRPYEDDGYSSSNMFRPVSIILNPDYDFSIQRIFPFDTGAYKKKAYSDYISDDQPIDNYELSANIEHAAKIVSFFFGDNKNYFLGNPNGSPSYLSTNLPTAALHNLISGAGKEEIDDRKSAIEVQVSEPIKLTKSSVMAVCMPTAFRDDKDLTEKIDSWEADIIEYDLFLDDAKGHLRGIKERTLDYLRQKGFVL